MQPQYIDIQEFTYPLPEERIAKFPLEPRDSSKLLLYKAGHIEDAVFNTLPQHLLAGSTLVFNNTKVIYARLLVSNGAGLEAEVFLLEPVGHSLEQAMQAQGAATWRCMVGHLKKWKKQGGKLNTLAHENAPVVEAELLDTEQPTVKLTWQPEDMAFGKVLEAVGNVPLPPYLKRAAEETDKTRYQTVYAKHEGAVAAPTAGLHFTDAVFSELTSAGHDTVEVTLHVSAGTFAPVKVANAVEHAMHKEGMIVTLESIERLLNTEGAVIPVGTTSMRTLESLYWYGVKLLQGDTRFMIEKLYAYAHDEDTLPTWKESYAAMLRYMQGAGLSELEGETEIMIMPGYTMRVCRGIVTNFHQPGSTLMLLVAALIGDDWKKVYTHALDHEYRFLSYGDSSLLLP